jgi:hypothetical protein
VPLVSIGGTNLLPLQLLKGTLNVNCGGVALFFDFLTEIAIVSVS